MPDPGQAAGDRLRLHLMVLGCQAGDERAFTRLFERFGPRTLGYLRGLVGDDADDVQQEVWLSVYRNVGTLANPGAFRTWLFQTTRHRALDLLRRRRREPRLMEESAADLAVASEGTGEAEPPALDRIDLAAVATQVSPAQREVLLLRYENDLSYGEIALVTGRSVGTVKSRLFTAHRRVQAILDAEAERNR